MKKKFGPKTLAIREGMRQDLAYESLAVEKQLHDVFVESYCFESGATLEQAEAAWLKSREIKVTWVK
jgi:hypothetical protein